MEEPDKAMGAREMKRAHKFKAKRCSVDGFNFDSLKEMRRWSELVMLERAGVIEGLERQVAIVLAPAVKLVGEKRTKKAVAAVIDFKYRENGEVIYEDAKGVDTPVSRLKRHLLKAQHGIDVRTV